MTSRLLVLLMILIIFGTDLACDGNILGVGGTWEVGIDGVFIFDCGADGLLDDEFDDEVGYWILIMFLPLLSDNSGRDKLVNDLVFDFDEVCSVDAVVNVSLSEFLL